MSDSPSAPEPAAETGLAEPPSKELVVVPRAWQPPAVVDIGIDLASSVTRGVVSVTRTGMRIASPLARLAMRPPVVAPNHWPQSYLRSMADRGRVVRERREEQLVAQLRVAIPQLVSAVLDLIDLNQLVLDKVDFEKVVAGIDIQSLVRAMDIDSIARELIVSIDLPELIRDSSGAMASETVVGVRLRGMEADDRVAGIVDRLMRRRHGRGAPTEGGKDD